MRPLWLASGSPRRRDLLERVGYTVHVQAAAIDEERRPEQSPLEHVLRLARDKSAGIPTDWLGLSADTIVHLNDQLLEKPADRTEAASHLRRLSGRWHEVSTGVCVRRLNQIDVFSVSTRVRFRSLKEEEIQRYIATGEADDKAGAYAIQGLGGVLVAEVQGSWTNVMGLPMERSLYALAAVAEAR